MRWVVVIGCRIVATLCVFTAYAAWTDPNRWCDGVRLVCALNNAVILVLPNESIRSYILALLLLGLGAVWWFAPNFHYTARSDKRAVPEPLTLPRHRKRRQKK